MVSERLFVLNHLKEGVRSNKRPKLEDGSLTAQQARFLPQALALFKSLSKDVKI